MSNQTLRLQSLMTPKADEAQPEPAAGDQPASLVQPAEMETVTGIQQQEQEHLDALQQEHHQDLGVHVNT